VIAPTFHGGVRGTAGKFVGVRQPDPSISPPRAASVPGGPVRPRDPGRAPTTVLRAARRPRMVALLVALLGVAAITGRLGVWQLDRAQQRGAQAESRLVAAQQAAAPRAIGDVLAPQASFRSELVGRSVQVRGRYEAGGQLVVAGRVLAGRTGYLVLTPLRVTDAAGRAGWAGPDPVLPVVRGWVADPAAAADLLTVPAGPVALTGYLQVSEGSGSGAAGGRTDAISSAELVNSWAGPIYSGYLVLVQAQPAQPAGIATLGPPTPGGGGSSWNIQNLAYTAQWWIFGAFALFLWVRLVRDEAAGDPADSGEDGPADDQIRTPAAGVGAP
jgi:cytochrome oxidase assembly protein ShyY1